MKMDSMNLFWMLITAISLFFNYQYFLSVKKRKEEEKKKKKKETVKTHLPPKQGFGIFALPKECRRGNKDVEDIEAFSKKLREEMEKLVSEKSFRDEVKDCMFVVFKDKQDEALQWRKGNGPIAKQTYHQRDFFDLTDDLEDECKGGMYFFHVLGDFQEIYLKYNPLVVLKGENVTRSTVITKEEMMKRKAEKEENEKKSNNNDTNPPLLMIHGDKSKRRDIRVNLENPILTIKPIDQNGGTDLVFKMGKHSRHFLFDSGAFDYQIALGVNEVFAKAFKHHFPVDTSLHYKGEIEFGPINNRRIIHQKVQFVSHNNDALSYYILGNSSFLMDNHFFYDADAKQWNFFEDGESGYIEFERSPQKPSYQKS